MRVGHTGTLMRFALLLLLSVACAAAALEIELLASEQAVVFNEVSGVGRKGPYHGTVR